MTVRLAQTKDIPRIHALLRQVEEVHHRIRPDLFRDGGSKYTDGELAAILADDSRPILAAVDGTTGWWGTLSASCSSRRAAP